MSEMAANEEMLVSETITSDITISNNQSSQGNEDEEQEQTEEQEEETKENLDKEKQQETNEAKQDLAYTGTEDIIPYIFIAMLGIVISYVRWKKYKDI